MKLMCILSLIFLATSCQAKNHNLTKEQVGIKNFGFSYCLTQSNDQSLNYEASKAMGGYFQKGAYDEGAYKNIKSFINNYMVANPSIYKETNDRANLMTCLDLYNSNGYDNVVKDQNKFIIK